MRRQLATALLLAAATLARAGEPPAPPRYTPGEPVKGTRIQDLYYGQVLFDFYQDEHFNALNSLLTARRAGRLPNHGAEGELLLGGLYLHYGQHLRAEQIFTALLAKGAEPAVRDRAWFYLGKVRYQRGLHAEALADFARVGDDLPEFLAVELPHLKAQAHMALGQFDVAAKLLDDWSGPDAWLPYARYNLGVALVRLGRLAEGSRQLDRVGRGPATNRDLRDLRDKANVALGYAYLQKSLDGDALPVLERVRLKGPYSTKAMLGFGWAAAATGQYAAALTPWLALKDRDVLDSAVQESLLAVPYAYGQLAKHEVAAGEYTAALATFADEIERLEVAILRAETGGLVPAVLAADDPGLGRWNWQLDEIPASIDTRYLYLLLADNGFQEGLRNVRDLRALERWLTDWAERVDAYRDIVATRATAYQRRDPAFESGIDSVDIAALTARRDALAARLEAAAADRDVAALASGEQRGQWQRIAALAVQPDFAGADPGLRDRHRFLRGVLLWDLDRDYRYRLWQQRRELVTIDRELDRAAGAHQRALGARAGIPGELATVSGRLDAMGPRLAALRGEVTTVRLAQEARLTGLAVAALRDQRDRLDAYRVQAQFALATIYDRAATAARATPQPTRAVP